jgi:hypothetical protein
MPGRATRAGTGGTGYDRHQRHLWAMTGVNLTWIGKADILSA